MRPSQFVTQCVTNWKCEIELTHVLEVSQRIAIAVFQHQPRRQRFQRLLAILGLATALLLVLDDQLADGPVLPDENGVRGNRDDLAAFLDDLADGPIKSVNRRDAILCWFHKSCAAPHPSPATTIFYHISPSDATAR